MGLSNERLSDPELRKARPKDVPFKLPDGKGLHLLVTPTGSKLWRFNYRHQGKHKTLALGAYPDVTLAMARERHRAARTQLAEGVDPAAVKQAAKAATREAKRHTVEAVAGRWLALHASKVAASTATATHKLLAKNLFPLLGARPIAEVTKADLLEVLQCMEARGAVYSAHKLLGQVRQIWRMAHDEEVIGRDVTGSLRGLLKTHETRHHPAITDPAKLGGLLQAIEGYSGSIFTQAALRLATMLFVRPGELRMMLWADVDLEKGQWAFRVSKTKTDHLVPLPRQAIAILTALHEVSGAGEYVLQGVRNHARPMSENTVNAALRYLGYSGDDVVGHGFRATARTILDEVLSYPPHIIEQQLSHAVRDPLGRAYNRTAHLPQRRAMMQAWADYLDQLKAGADVLPFTRAA